jgi:hypothetical protein
MHAPAIEAPPISPTNARPCPNGGECTAVTDSNGTWYCTKCGVDMYAPMTPPKIDNARTCDIVLQLRLSAKDVQRLLATIMSTGQYFGSREEMELHLTQELYLSILDREPTVNQMRMAREAMEAHMPELAKKV